MDPARLAIIAGMGLVTYVIRVSPQIFFVGRRFPDSLDRYLRYLAYAFIASIVSTSLFLSGSSLDAGAAPGRAAALVGAVLIASWSRSIVIGMLSGASIALALAWSRQLL